MLVEEAKEKICPFCDGVFHCYAAECMAWRWFGTKIKSDGYCGLAGKEGAE
jgi:hypothetical protein